MSDLIASLTLAAGLNTPAKVCAYLEISRATWYRRLAANHLRKCEIDALRARAGFLAVDGWYGWRVAGERIYSPRAGFAFQGEIENMDFIRQFAGIARGLELQQESAAQRGSTLKRRFL